MNVEKVLENVDRIICGKYEDWTQHAGALWNQIEQAESDAERLTVMIYFVENYSPHHFNTKDVSDFPGIGVSSEAYARLSTKLYLDLKTCFSQLLRVNPSSEVFAKGLLDFLNGIEKAEERLVALALVLQSAHLPYATYPEGLFDDPAFIHEGKQFDPGVVRSIALIGRMSHDPALTSLMRFAAVQKILKSHEDPKEFQIILGVLIAHIIESSFKLSTGRAPRGVLISLTDLEKMGAQIPTDLRKIISRDFGCGDPSCENCGGGRHSEEKKGQSN